MALISKETVDQIMHAADIAEVVGDYVTLKRKGQNLWAPCPFHNEKSPSFSVAPAKGIYKCFGCGKAGNSVNFIMDVEGISYVEALKYLAKKYGIEVAEEAPSPEKLQHQHERDSQFILSDFAKDFYQHNLHNHEQGQSIGLPYLKERGLSLNTIKKFELGYSLEAWDGLTKAAQEKGFQEKFLEKTGLTIFKEDGKKYDRFRARVMFPIHNISGRTIGFGARTLKTNDKSTPKYLNSPESEIYHKSDVLYGMFQAKQAIRMADVCYMTEGYLDVISLHQGGIENVVASSGTSLTENQVKLISRYTKNITVLYDGDAAGIKASLRGTDIILEAGLNVDVVIFPPGEDPDSYIRKVGDNAFREYIKNEAKDFISFKTELFVREAKDNPVKKAEAIREIVQSIAKIPDSIKRSVFLQRCSNLFGIDEQVLISEYNKIALQENKKQQNQQQPSSKPYSGSKSNFPPLDEFDLAAMEAEAEAAAYEEAETEVDSEIKLLQRYEREILRLLLNYSDQSLAEGQNLAQYLFEQLEDIEFKTPTYAKLMALITEKMQNGVTNLADYFIREETDPVLKTEAIDLLTQKYELSEAWETHQIFVPKEIDLLQYAADTSVLRLKWRNVQGMIKENQDELQKVTDTAEMMKLLQVAKALKTFEMEIAGALGIVVAR
ncbi:DNA primase [Adhaeribacter sp. BT258]|uniref:DNA primase n=1 Tax=Adhaeribacter terrigena TaxID=2793070 RepID=A0ABS1BYZ0_9BACT|nr:DNA primase [Adhaeribacter terrigena]MBK0402263.1 DNA primase [Adhaeribacter terrigena]